MSRRRVLAVLADSGPVVILALIAAAGSFTHIRSTAQSHGQRGWMSWACAVCIDLTCVMAARERQRDRRTRRQRSPLSWPTLVLAGGVLLSLAANLAQAQPSIWGWIVAGTPAAAFLTAVSMLERRASHRPDVPAVPAPSSMTVPPSFGVVPDHPADSSAAVPATPSAPELVAAPQDAPKSQGQAAPAQSAPERTPPEEPLIPGPLLDFARRISAEHQTRHGRPITRDALRARLGVSNQLASDLLRQIRTDTPA